MKRVGLAVLIICLAFAGLFVSCKNEVEPIQESEILVSVGFSNSGSRALSSNLEAFSPNEYYWAYAAQKADSSKLISGQTANYGTDGEVTLWVKTNDGVLVKGLGDTNGLYQVSGFSQGLWNFKLYAFKDVSASGTAPDVVYTGKQLLYKGETTGVLLKSSTTNDQGMHSVNVIVSPVDSGDEGTLLILTAASESEHITMTLLQSYAPADTPVYGVDYFPRVLSIDSLEENPTSYVDNIEGGTADENGSISLPAGTYKVTVSFSNAADDSATVNYARGTVIATVYSNLTTTIKGNLNEADVYAEFTSNQSINTVTSGTGTDAVEVATIAAAAAAEASSVAEPTTVSSSNSANTESAKTTISSTATAVEVAGDKKTTVTIPAAGLADTVVTKTLTAKTDDSNKTVTTVTESSTHDISMKVTEDAPSTFIVTAGSSAVAGVNLTLKKTTTTVTETATTQSGVTAIETTSETVETQDPITSFKGKYVTVSTFVETGLSGVAVAYDGTGDAPVFNTNNANPSVEVASADDTVDDAGTGYNPTTGLLVFKTNHFSSFVVTCYQVVEVTRGNNTTYYNSLSAFRDAVNAGDSFDDAVVTLMRNVDLKDVEWTPIGTSSSPFRGVFDGQGRAISNLEINDPNGTYLGVFGYVGGGNTAIRNVNLSHFNISAKKRIAGLVAEVIGDASFYNCSIDSSSTIIGNDANIAGLIGEIQPTVNSTINCEKLYNYATIIGTGAALDCRAAGICCQTTNAGNVSVSVVFTDCHNYGSVTAEGAYAGGISCSAQGPDSVETYDNCSSSGTLTGAYTGDFNAYFTGNKHKIVIQNYSGDVSKALGALLHGNHTNAYYVVVEGVLYTYQCVNNANNVAFGDLLNEGAMPIPDTLFNDLRSFAAYIIEHDELHRSSATRGSTGYSSNEEIFYNAMFPSNIGEQGNLVSNEDTVPDYLNPGWALDHYNTDNGTSWELDKFKPGWTSDTLYRVEHVSDVQILKADGKTYVNYEYPTASEALQAALDAVEEGETILLNADLELNPTSSEMNTNGLFHLTKTVNATLDLQGHSISCVFPQKLSASYFFLVSMNENNDYEKVFKITNGTWSIDWPNHFNSSTGSTMTAADAAIILKNQACVTITNLEINTDSTGIKMVDESRINELNANIICVKRELDLKKNASAAVNNYKCIMVGDSNTYSQGKTCKIVKISGGVYSSTIDSSISDVNPYMNPHNAIVIYGPSVIGEIEAGIFCTDELTGSRTDGGIVYFNSGGIIDSISGGVFKYIGEPTSLLLQWGKPAYPFCSYDESSIGAVTGGVFLEGYCYDTHEVSIDRKGRFDSAIAEGYDKLLTGDAITIGSGTQYEKTIEEYEIVKMN